jgi:hypothetical protein
MKKTIASAGVAALLALTGCASEGGSAPAADVECDVNDQAQYDTDCGYWEDGSFVFWYWVVLGQTSHGPAQQAPKGASTVKPATLPAKPPVKTQPKPPAAVPPKPANPGGGVKPPAPAPPKPPPPKIK